MATVGANYKTLIDLAEEVDDGGATSDVIELMSQENAILQDAPWFECNDGQGHISKVRTGLPAPTWRMLYQGVQPSKSTMAQIRDVTGFCEAYSEVDHAEYELAGDGRDGWRLQEEAAFIEGIGQDIAYNCFYGSTAVNPEKFTGLFPRYNALSGVNTAENVISAGGASTDNCSIALVGWGPTATGLLYPKGTKAGLTAENLGRNTKVNTDNSMYEVMRGHYRQYAGMMVRDWRTNGRIANIDVSDLRTLVANQKALITSMIQMSERVEKPKGGKQVWYAPKTVFTGLRLGILEKIAYNLTWETIEGKRVMMFDETEIHRCDVLGIAETVVS